MVRKLDDREFLVESPASWDQARSVGCEMELEPGQYAVYVRSILFVSEHHSAPADLAYMIVHLTISRNSLEFNESTGVLDEWCAQSYLTIPECKPIRCKDG